MYPEKAPKIVIDRLPMYFRTLNLLREEGVQLTSSPKLGHLLQLTPAQVRKDLSYFGRFGKQGQGYNVKKLADELENILNLNREWHMALVGVGKLGRAILNYEGFMPQGFKIVAAFDTDPNQVGKKAGNLQVEHIEKLPTSIKEKDIRIGIIAVPLVKSQEVVDLLAANGIKAILNYAPASLRVKPGIVLRNVDPVLSLQSMTYYLK